MNMLRQYEAHELETDGYPIAWSRCSCGGSGYIERSWTEHSFDEVCSQCMGSGSIKDYVREQAGNRCQRCGHPYRARAHGNGEWSPCDEGCTHGGPFRYNSPLGQPTAVSEGFVSIEPESVVRGYIEAQWRILTVHHLDGDKANCRWWNLAALCQRCHLSIQGRVIMERAFILEHSEWFKLHAAGWYAEKYLGEDVTREQALTRMDELLALERLA